MSVPSELPEMATLREVAGQAMRAKAGGAADPALRALVAEGRGLLIEMRRREVELCARAGEGEARVDDARVQMEGAEAKL